MTPFTLTKRHGLAALSTLAAAALLLCDSAIAATASYAERPEAQAFVTEVAQRNGFDPAALLEEFRGASYQARVVRAIMPPRNPRIRSWRVYRSRYLDPARLEGGQQFWARHEEALRAAEAQYGVPPEIVVAIIGVETIFGRMTGDFQTLSALATLAFDYPPRAELFRSELEALLLLARDRGQSPGSFYGSFAGALGLPQFLPSSYRRYAVDFDNDGGIDLSGSPADAIGSVANFLQQHGWRRGGIVAVRAQLPPEGPGTLADGGVEPKYTAAELALNGIVAPAATEPSALIDLVSPDRPTEYWLGFQNFYVLTRYNRSSFYAMAVFQLAQALREARPQRMPKE